MITAKRKMFRQAILASFVIVILGINGASSEAAPGSIFYVIVACDTSAAAGLGTDILADRDIIVRVFQDNFPKDQRVIKVFGEAELTKQKLVEYIQNLPIRPQMDSLIVFFSGHGEYSAQEEKHILKLPGRQDMVRSELQDVAIAKQPQGLFLITDCCAAYADLKAALPHSPPKGIATNPDRISPLFQTLFLNRTGLISITSSEPGQVSITRGDGKGSLFTYCFVKFLKDNVNQRFGWNHTLSTLKDEVDADFKTLTHRKKGPTNQPGQTVHSFCDIARLGMRAQEKDGRLIVTQILPLSPASIAKTTEGLDADLEIDDILLKVNGIAVNTQDEYSHAVDDSPKLIKLSVRDSKSMNILALTTTLNPLDE